VAAIREDLVRSENSERKVWFWCEKNSYFGKESKGGHWCSREDP